MQKRIDGRATLGRKQENQMRKLRAMAEFLKENEPDLKESAKKENTDKMQGFVEGMATAYGICSRALQRRLEEGEQ